MNETKVSAPGSTCLFLRTIFLVIIAGASACSTLQSPLRDHLESTDETTAECAAWFQELDSAVARGGVGDIASRPVAGFPYLRIDRFLVAMKGSAMEDVEVRQEWLARMRALDADGRSVEIKNLSSTLVNELAVSREELGRKTEGCARHLMSVDLSDEASMDAIYRSAFVADDYSTTKRGFGLYEITRHPFYSGVRGWQERATQSFELAGRGALPSARLITYFPGDAAVYSRQQVADLLADAAATPLGLPVLTLQQRERLFATYAPVFEIETAGDFDRIGRMAWSPAAMPLVDTGQPVVYRRLGYTRMDGQTLLQLEYLLWLPERPKEGSFDLLGGNLDGLVWRVTLAPDGEPVLFDSIHPCGCYHMFFPTPRMLPKPPPQPGIEWAFTPLLLPRITESERLILEVQTGTHYLRNIRTSGTSLDDVVSYTLIDYDELRSLPLPQGGSRSLFGPDGLVAGSERGERYLFWPMGISSPGAMRQAGTQATAFVGRRHFDDADLLDRRFSLQ